MNKVPYELIALLSDGAFHSGEAIGEQFNISRSAVWKQLKKLAELDIEIESVKGKGYRICRPFRLYDTGAIRAALNETFPQASLDILPITDSTNDVLNRRIFDKQVVNKGDLVLAEQQTAGKGRRGRAWQGAFAKNIMMSLVWSFEEGLNKLDGLSLVVGLALADTLRAMSVPDVALKWPNDVMVGNKKIAGILLEMNGDPMAVCQVVIGVGVNVNMALSDVSGIDQPWTSVSQVLGKDVDRSVLLSSFIRRVIDLLGRFERYGFEPLRERWGEYDWLNGQSVVLKLGERRIFGVAEGVDGHGGLMIRSEDQVATFVSGEVSVRRTYD